MSLKRVLCGVDFSEESVRAFHAAIEITRQSKGRLHVLHVVETQLVVPGWLPAKGLSEMILALEEKATAAMQSLIESSSCELDGLAITTEISSGRAFVEILNRAREWNPDLIIAGAKGAASLEEVVAGSTAEHVVREALCSVLAVR
jgi:nucleotide-binding universal stress UspA family protein